MAVIAKLTLDGGEQTLKRLALLKKSLRGKIVRSALRAGGKISQKKAQALAPRGATGRLAKRIRVRAMKRKRDRIGYSVVSGKKDYAGETYYAAFVDQGHHIGRRSLPDREYVPGRKFFEQAFNETKTAAAAAINAKIRAGIRAALPPLRRILPG